LLLRQIRGDECLHACVHRLRDRVGAAGKRGREQGKRGGCGKNGSVHDSLPNVSEKKRCEEQSTNACALRQTI
jgi:hypothetical protein